MLAHSKECSSFYMQHTCIPLELSTLHLVCKSQLTRVMQTVRKCFAHSDGSLVVNNCLTCPSTLFAEVHAKIMPPCQLLIRDIRVCLGDAWEAIIRDAFEPYDRLKEAVLEQASARELYWDKALVCLCPCLLCLLLLLKPKASPQPC